MPKMTRSPEEVEAVREQILDVAFQIVAKSGYEGLKMARIASKMNMTAANLYNYFSSKDSLLIAIQKKSYIMLYDSMLDAVGAGKSSLEKMKNMAYAYVEFGIRNGNIYDLMFNRPVKRPQDFIGTPLEPQANDEHLSSQRGLHLALKIMKDYWETKKNVQAVDFNRLSYRTIITLHGIISLYNGGGFFNVVKDSTISVNDLIDDALNIIID